MSSVFLLRDRGPHKQGEVVSVPFGLGRMLVAQGAACYPADAPKPKAPEPVLAPVNALREMPAAEAPAAGGPAPEPAAAPLSRRAAKAAARLEAKAETPDGAGQ